MKRQLFIIVTFLSFWICRATGQTVLDTLDYPVQNAGGFVIIHSIGGGYIFGTNSVITHVGQYFSYPGQMTVKGVILWCGAKEVIGSPDTYSIQVYNAGSTGLPTGSALTTKTFTTSQIDTSAYLSGATTFLFGTQPSVTDKFIITVEVAGSGKDDTLGFVSNESGDGMGLGRSLLKWNALNGGTWEKFNNAGFDQDIIILPIVERPQGCIMTLSSSIISSNTSCVSPNGSFRITPSNGTPPYQYSNSNGTSNSTGIFTGLAGGYYTVTVTDAANCTATKPVAITDASGINLSLNVSNIVHITNCYSSNGDFTVTWSGGTTSNNTFTLSGPVSGQVPSVPSSGTYSYQDLKYYFYYSLPDLVAGNYTLTFTSGNGCTKSVTFTINNLTGFTASISGTQGNSLCGSNRNGQVTLAVSGGNSPYHYDMDNGQSGSFSSGTYTINSLPAGNYNITINDQYGCQETDAFTIADNAPSVHVSVSNVKDNSSCSPPFTGSFNASGSGGASPYTYSGAGLPSNTTGSFQNLSSGSYTVMATDVNGCFSTASVNIGNTSGSSLSASVSGINANSSCSSPNGGFTLNISGGTAPYTIINLVNSGQTQVFSAGSFSNAQLGITGWGGDYGFSIKDNSGCSAVVSFNIPETAPRPNLSVISITANTNCGYPYNGGVTVSTTGGSGIYDFTANGSHDNNNGIFSGLNSGKYLIEVEDYYNSCFDTISVMVPDLDNFDVSVEVTNSSTTSSNNGTATITVTGGTPPYSYYWDYDYNDYGPTRDSLAPGTYFVDVEDAGGCYEVVLVNVWVVGIEENNSMIESFKVFPNPGSEKIFYEVSLARPAAMNMELVDIIGRKLIDNKVNGQGKIEGYFDVSHLAPGIYFAKISGGDEMLIEKVIVK